METSFLSGVIDTSNVWSLGKTAFWDSLCFPCLLSLPELKVTGPSSGRIDIAYLSRCRLRC